MARRMVSMPKHRGMFGVFTKTTHGVAGGVANTGVGVMDSGKAFTAQVGDGSKSVVKGFLGFFVPKKK